jgi:dolichol kinase
VKIFEIIDEIVLRIGGEDGVKRLSGILLFSILGTVAHFLFPIELPSIVRAAWVVVLAGSYLLILLEERRSGGGG